MEGATCPTDEKHASGNVPLPVHAPVGGPFLGSPDPQMKTGLFTLEKVIQQAMLVPFHIVETEASKKWCNLAELQQGPLAACQRRWMRQPGKVGRIQTTSLVQAVSKADCR